MQEVFIGEVIRERRQKLGITQEDQCAGICEPSTISRVESGKQSLSKLKLDVLLQRMGLSDQRYYVFLGQEEKRLMELQKEIRVYNIHEKSQKGLEKLAELENLAEKSDQVVQQFILSSKAVLGKMEDGKIQQYSSEERLSLLTQAILLTCPDFHDKAISEMFYGITEVEIIDQIAKTYSQMGEKTKSIFIYRELLNKINKLFRDIPQYAGVLSKLNCHYAEELLEEKNIREALKNAKIALDCCVKYRRYHYLPEVLTVWGEIHYSLKEIPQAVQKYKQAYYLYQIIQNPEKARKVCVRACELFHVPDYSAAIKNQD